MEEPHNPTIRDSAETFLDTVAPPEDLSGSLAFEAAADYALGRLREAERHGWFPRVEDLFGMLDSELGELVASAEILRASLKRLASGGDPTPDSEDSEPVEADSSS